MAVARLPLKSPSRQTKTNRVHSHPAQPWIAWFRGVLLQAAVWAALTVAFAALLKLSGPQSWPNALQFSAYTWMPWALLAPVVFGVSARFPIERGRLWRNIPVHAIGCAGCVAITLWISTSASVAGTTSDRVPVPNGRDGERMTSRRSPTASLAERLEHSGRTVGADDGSRPRSPVGSSLLGATLLRANFDAAIYLIIVAAAHAVSFYRRAQERERQATALSIGLNRARLDALRLQLQPHFLFNTLNAISTLVHRDPNAADNLIGDLAELLRLSLQTTDHEVPLNRELELLQRYLTIEQTRLGDRLRVVRDIDPTALEALVPTLLLQPLVENAVRHGIEPRLAPGTVTLRARRQGGLLLLSVIDDGAGLTAGGSDRARSGVGVRNCEARLQTLYGAAAALRLESPLGAGVQVHLSLPFRTAAEAGGGSAATRPSQRGESQERHPLRSPGAPQTQTP